MKNLIKNITLSILLTTTFVMQCTAGDNDMADLTKTVTLRGIAAVLAEVESTQEEVQDAEAQCRLAYCYFMGKGVPQDLSKAIRLYTLAANQGYAMAQCNLGVCYEDGRGGVTQNLAEAVRLYTLAANQGDAVGQCHLARCYADGIGVTKDFLKAVHLYSSAANKRRVNTR